MTGQKYIENIGKNSSVSSVSRVSTYIENPMPISSGLTALEYRQPDLVSAEDWQRAVDDGRRFIVQWGEQAEALGWIAEDLFGLQDPPEQPGPNYRRLSRYDVIGLIWLLHGRPVVALTADRAVIDRVDGPTFYRHPQARQVTR
jgi:hypothetical protein